MEAEVQHSHCVMCPLKSSRAVMRVMAVSVREAIVLYSYCTVQLLCCSAVVTYSYCRTVVLYSCCN